MKDVVLNIAVSLDGYIADKSGGVDWLGGDGSDPENQGGFLEFLETVDTVVMGYKTYNQIVTELNPEGWAYPGKTSYVLTHRKLTDIEEIKFTSENPCELVKRLRKDNGRNIWICGGASVINPLLDSNLIDIISISVMPTILGGGVKLFGKRENSLSLKFMKKENNNGIIDLLYKINR